MEKTSFLKEAVGGQSVVNKIVDNITNAIINGELNPGDKIPTEAELSESMGVGRNSVREAIKVLEAYGVVHIKRAEGTFVSQEYDSKMIYPVLYGIILQKDSTKQIVELRKVIDVGLLQLAVDKLKSRELEKSQMEAIEHAMEELERQAHMDMPQVKNLCEADVQFHMAIVGITENVMLQSICNYVDKITRRSRMSTIDQIFQAGDVENFLDMHRRIVKLLQDRDAAGIYGIVEEHYQYWAKVKDES
ncbi:FadR/GntR family transcriptional regulator [Enterocloster citroniae]|uniref:FadR/GntR family transcriptional regulator n=1 Tax=Enterocloster citroniae TaxID=358743 RepID=UPI0030491386|nr:GntR family transcriptional regulator [Enterocloster citroniae]